MAGTFKLRVVAPEGQVLREDCEFVVLPGEVGELGILRNHAPLIAGLRVGVVRYTIDSKINLMAVSGGFVEVADNVVSLLAETAEPGDTIDLKRALAAKERAEKRLSHPGGDVDLRRAEMALRKALARISAAEGGAKYH
ncbi:ATP synthase, Delta/Epsilon chain, beta-sandwich domain protein [Acididesulfobacillus acetoxydans]|uniref:ATP synthase epsilon chain n=1 Tax=Acididesulfobacillus acetoxydans TaxID=1561005 RepID=A0A8S0Y1N7_9FIRM|nr:F0F1 ATP synthase subunit epsilon [Acididesulfobacillus acetoxydans]CAA7599725.1 ATP synthase, Delta/Epsilon chain, beta-sandwich domain protein [Acididesulfobacillus acetoxydans]CEJ06277.1 ATP synthase epsilon chain [Acididesulfobacillus acetoxydans]